MFLGSKIFQVQKLYKGGGKGNVKEGWKKGPRGEKGWKRVARLKTKKETWERGLSCAWTRDFTVLLLYLIYYKSLCGCRQVAEPPKITWVVSFGFGSILALFYHPNSLQWTKFHEVTKLFCGSIIVTFYVPSVVIICFKSNNIYEKKKVKIQFDKVICTSIVKLVLKI